MKKVSWAVKLCLPSTVAQTGTLHRFVGLLDIFIMLMKKQFFSHVSDGKKAVNDSKMELFFSFTKVLVQIQENRTKNFR